jgi:hypothetical protein
MRVKKWGMVSFQFSILDFLGRAAAQFQHTVRYTELAPDRFKDFWR